MREAKGKTVFVGLSGGVDSSVAAARLLKEGYRVVGVFIKVWHPSFLHCNWEQERLDAMRVCATLSIPFLTCDVTEQYKAEVVDYLISAYKAGNTPNPDVMCNKQVKFGAFLDFADENGADYIATGHYAQCAIEKGAPRLRRGTDPGKDQSYFLWTLTPTQLSRTLFPVGDSLKQDIRGEARKHGLPTAEKPDSQGVCFLGELDMKSFLSHFIPQDIGEVEDASGKVIGEHDGAYFYTIGQRHGFRMSHTSPDEAPYRRDTPFGHFSSLRSKNDSKGLAKSSHDFSPYYIVAKNIKRNILTVSHEKPAIGMGAQSALMVSDTNWIETPPVHPVGIQIRYRQTPVPATVKTTGATAAVITPLEALDTPALGQSCVVYDGPACLGGGVVSELT